MNAARMHKIRRGFSRYLPPVFLAIRKGRRSLHQRRERQIARQLSSIKQEFTAAFGWTVQEGPFRGLEYLHRTRSDTLLPRVIGCYEAEIHASVDAALARQPSVIVDIGCEEGYYAVGLALRQPAATVYAYDIDPGARQACREMAELNGAGDRVVIGGECTPASLESVLGERGFVFCDCEGCEIDLLSPEQTPSLRSADILIELHDHVRTDMDITAVLLARFKDTHEISVVDRSARDPSAYPCLSKLPAPARRLAVHEDRMPYQQWAFLKSRV